MAEQLSPDVVFSFDPAVQAQIRARDAVSAANKVVAPNVASSFFRRLPSLSAARRQATAPGKGPLHAIPSLLQKGGSLRGDLEHFRTLGRTVSSYKIPTTRTFGAGQAVAKGLLGANRFLSTPASGGVSDKAMVRNVGRAVSRGASKLFKVASSIGGRIMKGLKVPSMAEGGMVEAPKYTGKLVNLHKGELVIPARKVASVRKALRKSGVTVPLRRR